MNFSELVKTYFLNFKSGDVNWNECEKRMTRSQFMIKGSPVMKCQLRSFILL